MQVPHATLVLILAHLLATLSYFRLQIPHLVLNQNTKSNSHKVGRDTNMSTPKKTLFSSVLLLSAVLLITFVESRPSLGGFGRQPTPNCKTVFGVRTGDTCFEITQLFNLTTSFFELINPNLVCNKMFVSEWVCVDGTLS